MRIYNPQLLTTKNIVANADLDMLDLWQIKNLAAPATGEALRAGNKDIGNAEVKNAAAITRAKLNFGDGLVNADIAAAAAIALTKLASTPGATVVLKASEETVINNSTLQDDDELLFAVGVNEVWEFFAYIRYNSHFTPDFKFAWAIPTAASIKQYHGFDIVSLSEIGDLDERDGETSLDVVASAESDKVILLQGLYIGGANAGNVQFQWAQKSSDAAETKVLANSFIVAHKLS